MRLQDTHLYAFLFLLISFQPGSVFSQDIVGGKYVEEGKYPFMVGLVEADESNLLRAISCGATLINERWVLTAGHCMADVAADDLEVLVGTYNLENPTTGYRRIEVDAIYMHPDYHRIPFQTPDGQTRTIPGMDIALIRLAEPVYLPTISLPKVNDNSWEIEGLDVHVMGWGRDDPSTPTRSSRLKEAAIQLISQETCKEYEYYDILVNDNMLCAGLTTPGKAKGGAAGDSGGPLIVQTNEGWTQLGIMSWGIAYTEYEKPGVYQKVYRHLSWIDEMMGTTSSTDIGLEGELDVWRNQNLLNIASKMDLGKATLRVFAMDGQLLRLEKLHLGVNEGYELLLPSKFERYLIHLSTSTGSASFIL